MHVEGVGASQAAVRPGPDHDPRATLLEVPQIRGQAEDGHDLRRRRDGEAVLAGQPAQRPSEADGDVAERAIVHVDRPTPVDAPHIDAEAVAPVQVVVQCR